VTALFAAAIFGGAMLGVFPPGLRERTCPRSPRSREFQPNIITQVFANDGSVIGEFAIEKRVVVQFRDIPPVLPQRDRPRSRTPTFWKHIGINPWRVPGAAIANLRSGRYSQGFSTLTMQLSRTAVPHAREDARAQDQGDHLLASRSRRTITKEEILTLYCNQVYFGHGHYGVEAASRFLFGKAVKDLTLEEARSCGTAQSPIRQSRSRTRSARSSAATTCSTAWPRRSTSASRSPRPPRPSPSGSSHSAIPALESRRTSSRRFRKYLEKEYGSQRIYQGGLRVYTTLDPNAQRAAVQAQCRNGLRGARPPRARLREAGGEPS
jgi:penicillin-binding protein 1A